MSDNQKHCAVCNNAGKQLCTGCGNINYCSRTCQKSDWPTHKLLRKTFKDFINRPSPNSRRVILFPMNKEHPKFIWVNSLSQGVDDVYFETVDVEQLEALLEGDEVKAQRYPIIPHRTYIERSARLNRSPPDTIILASTENYTISVSTQNTSIMKLTDGASCRPCHGPTVAYGMKGEGTRQTCIDDLDTTDFKPIVDCLCDYFKQEHHTTVNITPQP